jgi:hypothetical protein
MLRLEHAPLGPPVLALRVRDLVDAQMSHAYLKLTMRCSSA